MARRDEPSLTVILAAATTVGVASLRVKATDFVYAQPASQRGSRALTPPDISAAVLQPFLVILPYVGLFLVVLIAYAILFRHLRNVVSLRYGTVEQFGDVVRGWVDSRSANVRPARGTPAHSAASPRPTSAPSRAAPVRPGREASCPGRVAAAVLVESCGHGVARDLVAKVAGESRDVGLVALVGTSLVVLEVVHLKGLVTNGAADAPWLHASRREVQREIPNPVERATACARVVRGVVGEGIAVLPFVVLTGSAEVKSVDPKVVRLRRLGDLLDRVAKSDGCIDAATAAGRFAYLGRALGRP